MMAVLVLPQTAMADLGDVLGEIEWGDDRDEVLEKLSTAKLDAVREDPQFRGDPAALQRARQRTLDRVRAIEDSYYELEGDSTNYDMSVVASEFTTNNNESLLRVRDRVAQRYYFFIDGEFYKMSVAYDGDHVQNVGFEAFVNRVRQQYGDPASTDYDGDDLSEATWRDDKFELRVNDRRDYFGTFTMTFSDRQRLQRLAQEGREFGGSDFEHDEGPTQMSERVQAVTTPSGDRDRSRAADAITGGVGEEITLGSDEEEEEADEPPSEPAASPSPAQEEQPAPATTTSPTPASDDDDDLVIY